MHEENQDHVSNPLPAAEAEKVALAKGTPWFKKINPTWIIIAVFLLLIIIGFSIYKGISQQGQQKTQSAKVYRVGVLAGLNFFLGTIDGFKEGMETLGYVEGENIVYIIEKTPTPVGNEAVIQKFVDQKVDLILTFPTEPSLEAKKVTEGTNIPVIFTNAGLDGVNLIDSIQKPGANITGVQFPTADTAVQRLEIIHEIAPKAKNVWVTYLKDYPIVPEELRRLKPAAESMGITIIEVPATTLDDVKADLEKREKSASLGIDAIIFIPEPLTAAPEAYTLIGNFATKHKLPLGGTLFEDGVDGSLFGYTPDSVEVGKQAAILADKIFKGTPAGTIPVISAENYLVINYKVAQKNGLTISEALLSRARKIIR
ncbi:MAG TPA: ABC transporter substrate-binding protein [Patescibacteria group bacterium]|nr:ABC transporter substrate-binding protein [Patescibacteria group bacterium]